MGEGGDLAILFCADFCMFPLLVGHLKENSFTYYKEHAPVLRGPFGLVRFNIFHFRRVCLS